MRFPSHTCNTFNNSYGTIIFSYEALNHNANDTDKNILNPLFFWADVLVISSFSGKSPLLSVFCAQSLSCVWLFVIPMDCSLPGSSVHGIFQARILEWVAVSFSRGFVLTQESNQCLLQLLHWQADSLPLSHLGGPPFASSLVIFGNPAPKFNTIYPFLLLQSDPANKSSHVRIMHVQNYSMQLCLSLQNIINFLGSIKRELIEYIFSHWMMIVWRQPSNRMLFSYDKARGRPLCIIIEQSLQTQSPFCQKRGNIFV